MLNLALTTAKTQIEALEVSGVPLIEKYGGLVFTLSIPEKVGETSTGDPILKEKSFPVACGVDFNNCVNGKRYQELVPNSRYRSIAYWEQMGDAVLNSEEMKKSPKGGALVYDIPARLVVWLNIQKLNINNAAYDQCSIVAPVMLAVENALHDKNGFLIADATYQKANVKYIFRGQEKKDPNTVFGKYSYGQETAKFMLWPYDFFAMRYTVRLRINRDCVNSFVLGAAVSCVDES